MAALVLVESRPQHSETRRDEHAAPIPWIVRLTMSAVMFGANPRCAKRIALVQSELRKMYALAKD
jgi:hypothetical protein